MAASWAWLGVSLDEFKVKLLVSAPITSQNPGLLMLPWAISHLVVAASLWHDLLDLLLRPFPGHPEGTHVGHQAADIVLLQEAGEGIFGLTYTIKYASYK